MSKLDGLNKEQKAAVTHKSGPMLVIAGAGTGKTTVITRRIAYLIENNLAEPDEILALTFTDKAAAEMENRLDRMLPYGVVNTNIMTFHSLGDRILREEGLAIGLRSDFVIMPQFSQVVFLQNLIDKAKLKYYKPLSDPFSFIQNLLVHFSRLKDDDIDAKTYLKFAEKTKKTAKTPEDKLTADKYMELAGLYSSYVSTSRAESKLDFGDQIQLCLELFNNRADIRREYSKKYKYILVDEFQDTNIAQNKLLEYLIGADKNIMVVGDDDQAIYRFRGAAITNILSFKKKYPKAKQVVLVQNYRSTKQILDSAYELIRYNNPDRLEITNKIDKKLTTTKNGDLPRVIEFEQVNDELEFISSEIKRLTSELKVEPKDIAILVRKNNQIKAVASQLGRSGIEYRTTQSSNLLDRAEVRILINFTRFINDPKDSAALYSLLLSEIFDIDSLELSQLSSQAKKSHQPLGEFIKNSDLQSDILQNLIELEDYRNELKNMGAGELLYYFLQQSGYLQKLLDKSKTNDDAAIKIQNIAEFFKLVKQFEIATQEPNLYELWHFLDEIHSSSNNIFAQESPLDTNAVIITTIHKAKGLEYDAVFMIDLTQNTFPSINRTDVIPVADELLKNNTGKKWHTEEERRLFYVGMTRAKSKLYLTYSINHGGVRAKKPSQFVYECARSAQKLASQTKLPTTSHIDQFQTQPPLPFDPLAHLQSADGWLHLGVNQIADYIRSPQEFWFFNVLNVPKGPFHRLIYGSSIHAAIEAYLRSKLAKKPISFEKMIEVFELSWRSEGFVSISHERERKTQAQKVLRKYWASEQANKKKIPIEIELPFVINIEQIKLRISGRYDAVYPSPNGVEIRDFKTGDVNTQEKANKRLAENIQLDIYAYGWDMSHDTQVTTKSLAFVEYDILAKSEKIDHQATLAKLKKVADDIRARKFAQNGTSRLNFNQIL